MSSSRVYSKWKHPKPGQNAFSYYELRSANIRETEVITNHKSLYVDGKLF
jgi:hypothetical protein